MQQSVSVIFVSSCVLIFYNLATIKASSNIESGSDGSYCVAKIPKRGVAANCTSVNNCENILAISALEPPQRVADVLQCGQNGECVTKESPQNEHCLEACDKSPCAKLCLQEHETKSAQYCIETRDHPNVMPGNSSVPPNKYYCTCVIEQDDNDAYQYYQYFNYNRHRIVSRYLQYTID